MKVRINSGCPHNAVTLLTRAPATGCDDALSRLGFAPALSGLTWLIAEGTSSAVVPDELLAA